MAQQTIRNDENMRIPTFGPGKLSVATKTVTTKRAALGDLANKQQFTSITGKAGIQKTLKNEKSNVMTLRSRAQDNENKVVVDQQKKLTRAVTAKTTAVTTKPSVLSNVAKKVTGTVQVKAGQLPTVQSVTVKDTKTSENSLRREDSNLSQKSLSKLRALAKGTVTQKQNLNIGQKVDSSRLALQGLRSGGVVSKVQEKVEAKPLPLARSKIEDIDKYDANNPILVSEYVNDIYGYLRDLEQEQPVNENFLEGQQVTPRMRAVLIDWINEVHLQFHLIPETFQITVGIIDRYLQVEKNTSRDYLQLVGVVALLIASKYEELYPPSLEDFVYITDSTYDKAEILAMEKKIMRALDFNLSRPVPIQFLRRCSKAAEASEYHHNMAKYFLELVSLEYSLAHHCPSEIAAASLLLSLKIFNRSKKSDEDLWSATLEYYSKYELKQLEPLMHKIAKLVNAAPQSKLHSVFTKYSSTKFSSIAVRSELKGSVMQGILNED